MWPFQDEWLFTDAFGTPWRFSLAPTGESFPHLSFEEINQHDIGSIVFFTFSPDSTNDRARSRVLIEIMDRVAGTHLAEELPDPTRDPHGFLSDIRNRMTFELEHAVRYGMLRLERVEDPRFATIDLPLPAAEARAPEAVVEEKTTFVEIRLVDQDGNPVPRRTFTLTTERDDPREGRTNFEGRAFVGDLNPGPSADVVFPDFDERDFAKQTALPGKRSELEAGPVKNADAAKVHPVRRGETMSSLAARHGFENFETLWNAKENAPLRARRDNPQALLEGDEVALIEKKTKALTANTDTETTFTIFLSRIKLRVRLLDDLQRPVASQACKVSVDGETLDKTTDGDGRLELTLPRATSRVGVSMGEGLDGELAVGSLEPNTETQGIDERLRNLSFLGGIPLSEVETGDDVDLAQEEFELSLELFQNQKGLRPTAEPTSDTVDGIVEVSGS